jgi:hypothetical protein
MRALTWQGNEDVEVTGVPGHESNGCVKVVLQPERQPL